MSEVAMAEAGHDVRRAARSGFAGSTVGRAPGFAQANLFVVPQTHASAFEAFCRANAAACPLLARGAPGSAALPGLGRDIDVRTDLPGYLVHDASGSRSVRDLAGIWQPDLVAFAIGCWFGAEGALARAGIRMRHRDLGLQGGLYRTNRDAVAAGPFHGPLVVSMRPFADADVAAVASITARMPLSHGGPVHIGDPAGLGIADLARPDWGDVVLPQAGETPVFWPCGLTALAALRNAGLPVFLSHAPGAMLVTDIEERPEQ